MNGREQKHNKSAFSFKNRKLITDLILSNYYRTFKTKDSRKNNCIGVLNFMALGMLHIFSYLNMNELVTASKVCTSWNMVSRNTNLVRNLQF